MKGLPESRAIRIDPKPIAFLKWSTRVKLFQLLKNMQKTILEPQYSSFVQKKNHSKK